MWIGVVVVLVIIFGGVAAWQYVFPAGKMSRDPRSGLVRRHHLYETSVQKAVRQAARAAGITPG